jgi:hypothetical protein
VGRKLRRALPPPPLEYTHLKTLQQVLLLLAQCWALPRRN